MRRSLVWLVMSVFLGVGLSGCLGGGSGDPPLQEEEPEPTATGTIQGHVANAEIDPVAGASVGIVSTGQTTTTDSDGRFTFHRVEPGTYVVAAEAFGLMTATRSVTVGEGATANVSFILEPLPIEEVPGDPVYETQVFEGFLSCSISTVIYTTSPCSETCVDEPPAPRQCSGQTTDPNDRSEFEFEIPESAKQLIVELEWSNASVWGSKMTLIVYQCSATNCASRLGDPSGSEYLRWQANETRRPHLFNLTDEEHLQFLVYADWTIVPTIYWQQRFTMHVTSVYAAVGPYDWSALTVEEDS